MSRPKGLGRGLDALLGNDGGSGDALKTVPVGRLRPGRYQPRQRFDKEALSELAESIKTQGLMQPLLVRPVGDERFELIAGERRWRAAQLAGLTEVPVLVRDVRDEAALAMALIENIQREDLNPIEEATGVQRLVDEFKLTHEQAADAIGRSRSATTNLLRLLKLPRAIQTLVADGTIEMGHARALLPLDGARQIEFANRIAAKGLSVRESEALVTRALHARASRRRPRTDRDLARLEEQVSNRIGTTVQIRPTRKGNGKLIVLYTDLDHLDRLLRALK